MRPRKLTVTEWTESRNWTESTETYEAKRSASRNWTESRRPTKRNEVHRRNFLLGKVMWRCLAALPTCVVNPPASPERYVADVLQRLIVICCAKD